MKFDRMKPMASTALQWMTAGVIIIAGWTALTPHVSPLFLAEPSVVWDQVRDWIDSGRIWSMISVTTKAAVTGYAIGAALGVLLALCVGLLPSIFGKVVEPVVIAVYASPKFILIPILFVWLGKGMYPRVVLISLSVFALLFVNTVTGIRTVDPDRARMLQLLDADRRQVALKLMLPHTMGFIATGLTIAAPFAVTIAVGSEILFGSPTGIGGVLNTGAQMYNARQVLAALSVATILAALATTFSRWLGRKLAGPGGRFARF